MKLLSAKYFISEESKICRLEKGEKTTLFSFTESSSKMVLREQTVLQIQSMLESIENKDVKKPVSITENELFLEKAPSVEPEGTTPKLPTSRHAKSILGSGLFHAVYKCRHRKVKFLLDNGLSISAKNDYGYSVLVAALHIENNAKRSKMFAFLLDQDADPLQKDPKHKRNALAWASLLGREEQVNLLLDTFMGEFDFHEKDKDGMTPLHLATQAGHSEVVKSLVREMRKYGTTVDIPDNLGLTPFLHAKRLGYGLIADILKEEGGACVGHGDLYSFKRADEWRDIGIQERNEMVKQRRNTQYEQAAIQGSARMLMEFDGPGYEIITIPTPKSKRRPKHRHLSTEINEETSKSVRIMSPRSQSLPSGSDHKAFRIRQSLDAIDGRQCIDTMSLIQMREPKKGVAPKHFHRSEVDESKLDEYKHILGDITTMMDYLTMQHTKSFRRSVPPMESPSEESRVGQKRSTLAIIFGKNKRGRKSSRAAGSGKKKGEKSNSGKAKQGSGGKLK